MNTTVNKIKNFRGETVHTSHPLFRVSFEGGWYFSIALGFENHGYASNIKLVKSPQGDHNSDFTTIETTDLQDILKFCDLVVSGIIDTSELNYADIKTIKALRIPKNTD